MEKAVPSGVVQVFGPFADPAPLGLGGFAITLFIFSILNTGWGPGTVWVTMGLFYGGAAQFIAGMLEFPRNNVFGATAFATYGSFWLALALYFMLYIFPGAQFYSAYYSEEPAFVLEAVGWFITGFFGFTAYMTVCALQTCAAIFAVFFLLFLTLLCGFIGAFRGEASGVVGTWTMASGYFGFFCSIVALYASFAFTWNAMAGSEMMPVGPPLLKLAGSASAPASAPAAEAAAA